MTRRGNADREARARDRHHRSIDRLEETINERDDPYDADQAGRVSDASRREKRARAAHEEILGQGRSGRQDEAKPRD